MEDRIQDIDQFLTLEEGDVRALVRPEATGWVRQVLDTGLSLHQQAGRYPDAHHLEGRNLVHVIRARPTGDDAARGHRWAVRHYVRGGRIAPLVLGDRYLKRGTPRPFVEARSSLQVEARGIPTPKVLAAAVYPTGIFYRGDLVTEFVPESSNLVQTLFGNARTGLSGTLDRREGMRAGGRLIQAMARKGIHHPDLHAGNILLQWIGSMPKAHVLDLDRLVVGTGAKGTSPEPMYRRLRRSIRKWERRTGLELTEREWEELEAGVQG